MRSSLAFAVVLIGSLTACNSILDQSPPDALPTETSITDARGARAALTGAYNAMNYTTGAYYGSEFITFGDLSADNVVSTGISGSYAFVDRNQLRPNNASVEAIWQTIYDALNRVNVILEKVPPLTDLEETEKNQILGEAYALRALHLHNLTKFWGDIPMPLVSPSSVDEASQITRTPAAEAYAQIRADLAQAETLVTETGDATRVTTGFVDALQARVALYQADYPTAVAEADEVLAQGYELAEDFTTLFDAEGTDTPEDILKVIFTAEQFSWHGYLLHLGRPGRRRVGGTLPEADRPLRPSRRAGHLVDLRRHRGRGLGAQVPHHDRRGRLPRHPAGGSTADQGRSAGEGERPGRRGGRVQPDPGPGRPGHPHPRRGGQRPRRTCSRRSIYSASSSWRSRGTAGPTWFGRGWRTM